LILNRFRVQISEGAAGMEPYHWFFLGMMVAWTPALVVLALLLSRVQNQDSAQKNFENTGH
jgi:hypothetical protein